MFYVDVLVSEHSQLKGVRAYMVFDMLERSGEVVKAYPSVQDIEQEKFERSFSLYYITTKEAQELEKGIMSISEIETAKLIQLDQETLQQMANQVTKQVAATAEVELRQFLWLPLRPLLQILHLKKKLKRLQLRQQRRNRQPHLHVPFVLILNGWMS